MSKMEDAVGAVHRQSTGYLLARAHLLFRTYLAAALEGWSVHMGQVVVLASLHARNDLTQAQLTQISGIEKSSLVLFLDALEKGAWVERRPHPSDRRAYLVHLTDSGRARFTRVGAQLYASQMRNLACFDEAERKQLASLLGRLVDHLEAGPRPSKQPAPKPTRSGSRRLGPTTKRLKSKTRRALPGK
jgi:DNA-binding MarR family transcriptional regulator